MTTIFIADYQPLFLYRLDVAHFRECLTNFLRRRLPLSEEREALGDIFVLGLPGQITKGSAIGAILTDEMIPSKLTNKSLYKCVPFKDNLTKSEWMRGGS